MLNFSERLREERVRLGFNQADFAALGGVAKTSQFNYEKGERSPDAAYLVAIGAIGVDVLYVHHKKNANDEKVNEEIFKISELVADFFTERKTEDGNIQLLPKQFYINNHLFSPGFIVSK